MTHNVAVHNNQYHGRILTASGEAIGGPEVVHDVVFDHLGGVHHENIWGCTGAEDRYGPDGHFCVTMVPQGIDFRPRPVDTVVWTEPYHNPIYPEL